MTKRVGIAVSAANVMPEMREPPPYDIRCPYMKSGSNKEGMNYWKAMCKLRYEIRVNNRDIRNADKCYRCYKENHATTGKTLPSLIHHIPLEERLVYGWEWLKLREAGMNHTEIANKVGVTPGTVQRYISLTGTPKLKKRSGFEHYTMEWFKMFMELGVPYLKIAEAYKCSETTVKKYIHLERQRRELKIP